MTLLIDEYVEYGSGITISYSQDSDGNSTYINFTADTADTGCVGSYDITIGNSVLSTLSQFLPFDYTQINIDPIQAQQILDTNIFELIPQQTTRQQQIDKFFADYANLTADVPDFIENADGFMETEDPEYDINNEISTDNPTGFIPRLEKPSNDPNDTYNLEWLRNDLNNYLEDIDSMGIEDLDDRPEYEDKSDGYLKIRHMNQAIIVRKEEGIDVGIQDSYLTDGFTITMWVRFLDKVNSGTLFNFGNPLREDNPMGFMLETFVVETDVENERYLRLVVREEDEDGEPTDIRDSHFGIDGQPRLRTFASGDTNNQPALEYDENYALNYTQVPIDLTEWYFIVANYNPDVNENGSNYDSPTLSEFPEYWQWNYIGAPTNSYTSFSGVGARCKVEIISKSDLIRARGFRQS